MPPTLKKIDKFRMQRRKVEVEINNLQHKINERKKEKHELDQRITDLQLEESGQQSFGSMFG